MNEYLSKKLHEKYPELFRDTKGNSLNYGFECGDGWYGLIKSICEYLMGDVNRLKDKIDTSFYSEEIRNQFRKELIDAVDHLPTVRQVKEKFGGLRFYVDGATEHQYDYIHFAESFSYSICEDCGTTGESVGQVSVGGWIRTVCHDHAHLAEQQRAERTRECVAWWRGSTASNNSGQSGK